MRMHESVNFPVNLPANPAMWPEIFKRLKWLALAMVLLLVIYIPAVITIFTIAKVDLEWWIGSVVVLSILSFMLFATGIIIWKMVSLVNSIQKGHVMNFSTTSMNIKPISLDDTNDDIEIQDRSDAQQKSFYISFWVEDDSIFNSPFTVEHVSKLLRFAVKAGLHYGISGEIKDGISGRIKDIGIRLYADENGNTHCQINFLENMNPPTYPSETGNEK